MGTCGVVRCPAMPVSCQSSRRGLPSPRARLPSPPSSDTTRVRHTLVLCRTCSSTMAPASTARGPPRWAIARRGSRTTPRPTTFCGRGAATRCPRSIPEAGPRESAAALLPLWQQAPAALLLLLLRCGQGARMSNTVVKALLTKDRHTAEAGAGGTCDAPAAVSTHSAYPGWWSWPTLTRHRAQVRTQARPGEHPREPLARSRWSTCSDPCARPLWSSDPTSSN